MDMRIPLILLVMLAVAGSDAADGANRYLKFREREVENEFGIKSPYTLHWRQPGTNDTALLISTGPHSNIRPIDYEGPEACRDCHPDIYRKWRDHSHRRMNQEATPKTVVGDFSGVRSITYHGITGTFFQTNGGFRMALMGAGRKQVYAIERTIGSRFYQYYTGIELNDLGSPLNERHLKEFVLPFGWWIDAGRWAPAVHVYHDVDSDEDEGELLDNVRGMDYDTHCTACHTTIPWGNMLVRKDGRDRMTQQTPRQLLFHYGGYLSNAFPRLAEKHLNANPDGEQEIENFIVEVEQLPTRPHAVALGVTCEACHHGGAAHIRQSSKDDTKLRPYFFPASPHLFARGRSVESVLGRTAANRNFLCAKCHVGTRSEYAAGHHAWNSTEYSDAIRGACYAPSRSAQGPGSSLSCVHCHDPHTGIGRRWSKTRQQDNQSCTSCHQELGSPRALAAHTHHGADSVGSDCMNCHMPKLNEGLQDLVRTHRIFSPTEPLMIEENQPNACNMCHVEKNLNWTLGHLESWYDRSYNQERIRETSPDPDAPATINWLRGDHQPSRMVAGDVLTKAKARWALADLVDALNDPALLNRQFLQKGLDAMLDEPVERSSGYRFHFPRAEREFHLHTLRRKLGLPVQTPEEKGRANL